MTEEERQDESVGGSESQELAAVQDADASAEREEPSFEAALEEAIDVAVEEIAPLRKKLTITVPRRIIDEQLDEQYDELRREAMVPGFRKGRAPRRLLEKRFGSEVGDTLIQRLVTSAYVAAMKKTELKTLGDPLIWATEKGSDTPKLMEVSEAIELMKVPDEGPLEFACEVEVQPEFELPKLEGIPLTRPVVEITDKDVDAQVDRLRGLAGSFENVGDGPVEPDDLVIADVKMTSGGEVLKQGQDVRLAARPQVVDGVVLENLGDVLAGAKVGDVRQISGQIPDAYEKEEFRGKEADFEITVKQIQRMRLPEVDQAFLNHWGFETEQDMRAWLRQELEARRDREIHNLLAGQVCEYLLQNTSFELPERVSTQQIDRALARKLVEMYRQGIPLPEIDKRMDELKTVAREETLKDLKLAFIMEKLAEQVEVEVTEGEINAWIAEIARQQGRRFDRVRDELSREGRIADLYIRLRDDKIIRHLIDKAEITESRKGDKPVRSAQETKSQTEASEEVASEEAEPGADEPARRSRPKRKPPKKTD